LLYDDVEHEIEGPEEERVGGATNRALIDDKYNPDLEDEGYSLCENPDVRSRAEAPFDVNRPAGELLE